MHPARAAAHAHAAADRHLPHDAIARREAGHAATDLDDGSRPLVARDDRVGRDPHPEVRQRAFEDLDVGAADADGARRDQQFALAGNRVGPLDQFEPLAAMEFDCVHLKQPSS